MKMELDLVFTLQQVQLQLCLLKKMEMWELVLPIQQTLNLVLFEMVELHDTQQLLKQQRHIHILTLLRTSIIIISLREIMETLQFTVRELEIDLLLLETER